MTRLPRLFFFLALAVDADPYTMNSDACLLPME